MELSGQLHTMATLKTGKEPTVATGEEAEWVPSRESNSGRLKYSGSSLSEIDVDF
jgi:hypothetical protein